MTDRSLWRLLLALSLGAAFTYWAGVLLDWADGVQRPSHALTLAELGVTLAAAGFVFAMLSGISLRPTSPRRVLLDEAARENQ